MAVVSAVMMTAVTEGDRWDAEFFDPKDLSLIKKLSKSGGKPLGEICDVLNGRTPEDYFDDGEIPIVRSGDLVAPFIYPECGQEFLRARPSPRLVALKKHDVLISSIGMGSIGKISLVMDAGKLATVSEVTVLRSKGYPGEILFAYLTTEAGQRQIVRQITGATGQQHLLKAKVESILVPAAPAKSLVDSVAKSCFSAWQLEMKAAAELQRTHSTFSKAMGIDA